MNKTFSDVTVKDADKGEVEAVFSTFNVVDKDGDVTLPDAIKDGAEVVISAYGHQSHFGALPVGKGVIVNDGERALMKGNFFLDTSAGRDTFTTVKHLGPLGEWSYSLNSVQSHYGTFDDQEVRFLESIFVKEVSPVLMGAGVGTQTLGVKSSLHDQIAGTVGAVKQAIDSAERVVALRAEKGKTLSNVNVQALDDLYEQVDRLKSLLDAIKDSGESDEAKVPEDIRAIARRFANASLFSSLSVTNGA
jgi:hypothetical protein